GCERNRIVDHAIRRQDAPQRRRDFCAAVQRFPVDGHGLHAAPLQSRSNRLASLAAPRGKGEGDYGCRKRATAAESKYSSSRVTLPFSTLQMITASSATSLPSFLVPFSVCCWTKPPGKVWTRRLAYWRLGMRSMKPVSVVSFSSSVCSSPSVLCQ